MKRILMIATTIALAAPAFGQNKEVVWPDCYCTDSSGGRVELGQTVCMYVDGRNFTARCEMSLNNPMWREVEEGCLSSRSLPDVGEPAQNASLVNAKI